MTEMKSKMVLYIILEVLIFSETNSILQHILQIWFE